MPMRIDNLIKTTRDATIYQLYDAGVHCYCVIIGMYLKYVVVFSLESIWYLYSNVVWLYVNKIYRNKIAWELNYIYGKT